MGKKALIFDILALLVWIVVLFFEIVFIQDIFFTIVAVVAVFAFAALLGRDIRRARSASA